MAPIFFRVRYSPPPQASLQAAFPFFCPCECLVAFTCLPGEGIFSALPLVTFHNLFALSRRPRYAGFLLHKYVKLLRLWPFCHERTGVTPPIKGAFKSALKATSQTLPPPGTKACKGGYLPAQACDAPSIIFSSLNPLPLFPLNFTPRVHHLSERLPVQVSI